MSNQISRNLIADVITGEIMKRGMGEYVEKQHIQLSPTEMTMFVIFRPYAVFRIILSISLYGEYKVNVGMRNNEGVYELKTEHEKLEELSVLLCNIKEIAEKLERLLNTEG